LPTVCLLWFMTQAVKNERLAIRQKLIDSYSTRGQEIFFKFPEGFIDDQNNFSASAIYDHNDKIVYPVPLPPQNGIMQDRLKKAWELEYVDKNYDEAIKEYERIGGPSSIHNVIYDCRIAAARCLVKQNKITEAMEEYRQIVYSAPPTLTQAAYAKLMLVDLYGKTNHKDLPKELQSQLSDFTELSIPTETKIFILEELIKLAEKSGLAENLMTEIKNARKVIDSDSLSVIAADFLAKDSVLRSFPKDTFRHIKTSQLLYGIFFKTADKQIIGLMTDKKMSQFWQKNVDDFTDKLVFCKIYDDKGQQISGDRTAEGELFSALNLKNHFTGWRTELYLRSGVFRQAADKKRFIYIWIASTVIFLMLSSTLLASKAVLKQAKLNKLKNDFIATITHELKTPLSSMRVLVDTLLEGRCESRQQETEYLRLISKENLRLSKLIDNFLTFSRMERNKQVFDIATVSPVEIANNAAEAVQAKFEKSNVRFSLNAIKPLPMIEADKDAMVTVLVNLLDNAYKYSNNDKQIELNVFTEDSDVCFAVKDNGIGMTRRQTKKIFDRFYQADASLSRRAEGAGLGLSIIKFIVDAHKGKIIVESKPDKGSVFCVKLPVSLNQVRKNGNGTDN
ncbi:MAG: HAMP domain-containing sensor histidine kinase, partial [Phycisphaerae bacterium]|nr:HAMP domain-containing sensor histidine kinase [Phycisphaerae bacterium]